MHVSLDPPVGAAPEGGLRPVPRSALNSSSIYPSTEQTLSSLSAVVNGGGLGQIGDIIHNFNAALNGREPEVRELLTRLNDFVGVLDNQRDEIIASIACVEPARRHVRRSARRHRPCTATDPARAGRADQGTAADHHGAAQARNLQRHREPVVNDTQADLIRNLQNLEPAIKALADVGPDLDRALAGLHGLPLQPDLRRPCHQG